MGNLLLQLFSYFHLIQREQLLDFFSEYKLTPLQIEIIDTLRIRDNVLISQPELLQLLVVSRPAMVQSVKTLEKKALVERMKIPDKPTIYIRLSDKAREEINNALKPIEQKLMQFEHVATLYPLLLELASKVDESSPIPHLKSCLNCLFYKEDEVRKGYCRYLKKHFSIYQFPLQCAYFLSLKELKEGTKRKASEPYQNGQDQD
jgi:DNA-binding MarR family transcriptional regulator